MKALYCCSALLLMAASCKMVDPETQCLPPPPAQLHLLLRDRVSGSNILDTPTQYNKDSIRYAYGTPNNFVKAQTDTSRKGRVLRFSIPVPNDCSGTDRTTGPWAKLFFSFQQAGTDSLIIDRPQLDQFDFRYNGVLVASRSLASLTDTAIIEARK